jgi:hypothetical protein
MIFRHFGYIGTKGETFVSNLYAERLFFIIDAIKFVIIC